MKWYKFLATFVITFLTSRSFQILFFRLTNQGQDNLYNNWFVNKFDHWQIGLMLIFISIFNSKYKLQLLAIGLGLFIEDLTFIVK